VNRCTVIYENGEFTDNKIPQQIEAKLKKYGIKEAYERRDNTKS